VVAENLIKTIKEDRARKAAGLMSAGTPC